MKKQFKYLNTDEVLALNTIVTDLESGHHLLYPSGHIRQYGYYKKLMAEVQELKSIQNPRELSGRQLEIQEFMKQCSDYYYWISLPNEEQYF